MRKMLDAVAVRRGTSVLSGLVGQDPDVCNFLSKSNQQPLRG